MINPPFTPSASRRSHRHPLDGTIKAATDLAARLRHATMAYSEVLLDSCHGALVADDFEKSDFVEGPVRNVDLRIYSLRCSARLRHSSTPTSTATRSRITASAGDLTGRYHHCRRPASVARSQRSPARPCGGALAGHCTIFAARSYINAQITVAATTLPVAATTSDGGTAPICIVLKGLRGEEGKILPSLRTPICTSSRLRKTSRTHTW